MDCIFCKIVEGELPCYKVYEDDNFLAFLDIAPLNLGHTLVIPKKHYRWVWDVVDAGDYFEVVAKIARAMKGAFDIDFVASHILGDDVPHSHIHLIPRFKEDGHSNGIDLKNVKSFSIDEMKKAMKDIIDKI